MRIAVVGATGFIGRHVVRVASDRGHEVIATGRSFEKPSNLGWDSSVQYFPLDIESYPITPYSYLGKPDCLVYLAWPGLPNYQELFHFENNLPISYRFLKTMVCEGLQELVVTGTCYEYGKCEGKLTEDLPSNPINAYSMAKDSLRQMLEYFQKKSPFFLRWARLFFVYGEGQAVGSLIPQLQASIRRGDLEFSMSGGEQLRDFLLVQDCASMLVSLAESSGISGIFNCSSGQPISVRRLVEQYLSDVRVSIKLNFGAYPYRADEAMAFWGCTRKMIEILPKAINLSN